MPLVIRNAAACIWAATLFALALCAAEEPKNPKPAETVPAATASLVALPPLPRETYTDPIAGYSVLIPSGYRKLTDDETRSVYKGISDFLSKGKDAGEMALRRPPANFIGTANPKLPDENPPSFAIGFTENNEQLDPSQMSAYKDLLEEKLKREGTAASEIKLTLVKVDGIPSLQVERDMINPVNNERDHVIQVIVPGRGKWFELIFNYSTGQKESVSVSLQEALDSFKVMIHPPENIENRTKWTRVLYYTLGFGLAGVLLSVIIRKLSSGGK